MKSEDFDRAFDDGEDVTSQLDSCQAGGGGEMLSGVDRMGWDLETLPG